MIRVTGTYHSFCLCFDLETEVQAIQIIATGSHVRKQCVVYAGLFDVVLFAADSVKRREVPRV